jgi:hypothetical protein
MIPKVNYKTRLKHLYHPSAKRIDSLVIPEMQYLIIDGKGEPGGESYHTAVEALFTVAYTMKFMVKREQQRMDYGVMPLEGLWWAQDMSDFITRRKERWQWTMMIMQPECTNHLLYQTAIERVRTKKPKINLAKLRFENFTEGLVAQTLHIGPFDDEGPTVERLHQHIKDSRHKLDGKHHEIYLTDIRRAAPQNWKTIIRQPMRKTDASQ